MTKSFLTLFATVAIAAPSLAASNAGHPIAFESDGVRYSASVIDRADGSQMIVGRDLTHGYAFALEVAKGQVNGVINGNPVSYAVPRKGSVVVRPVSFTPAR